MRYFHIFMLNRFCLAISASLFMFLAFSCSVRGVDTGFVIEFLPRVTPEFRNYCVNAVDRGVSQSELRESLFEFAKEGESSAAHTLWRSYQGKSLHEIVAELRKFASSKNPYACNMLASCLANQRNPECLAWYQIYDLNFTGEDPDFRGNYASAILRLKQPLNVEALKDVWRLLRAWREIEKTNSDEVLEGLYSALTKAAIKIKAKEFIRDLCTWASPHKDRIIHRGIIVPITENTEFSDIVIERNDEIERLKQQAKAYLERNQNNRQTMSDIISDNLATMLQDPAVRNIPMELENSKYFVNFNAGEPTEKHLKSWATLIVNKYRSKLIAMPDQNLALQDLAKRVKNLELLEYVLVGFRAIYGYEDDNAT